MTQQQDGDQNDPLKEKLAQAMQEEAENRKQEEAKVEEEDKGLQTQLQEMTEMNKRLLADMQNQKRRATEERTQTIMMANVGLIKQLLPVLDNLGRASQHVPEGAEEWFKGLDISIKQLWDILQKTGLEKIQAKGQPFDPALHEAVTQGPGPKDTVLEEFESGYTLAGQVIRHSKVQVGNGE